MRFRARQRVSTPVNEWLNGPKSRKVVKVDVYDATRPLMNLSGGTYINDDGLLCNRTTGNYAVVSDPTVNRHTGDMEIIVRVALTDWTPSPQNEIVSYGRLNDFNNVNYGLYVNTAGNLIFQRPSTTANRIYTSSVATGFTDGETRWLRATFDQDNGSSQSEVRFYTAADSQSVPTSWTQLGTAVTSADVGAGRTNDQSLWLGSGFASNAGDQGMVGTLRRAIIKNAIDGTTTLDADFDAQTYGTFRFIESSTNGRYVTITSLASWTGTWSLPAGASFVRVCCVGGGGGGGSGRKTSSGTAAGSGGSGASGGVSFVELAASAFTGPVTVTVGAAGTGGAARTTVQNGANGTNGSATTFGTFCGGGGGNAGLGGQSGGSAVGGAAAAGLYASAGVGNSEGARATPTVLVSAGSTGRAVTSGGLLSTTNAAIGTAGLVIGSDVIAVRNFISGSGGNAAITGVSADSGTNGQSGCGGGSGGGALDPVNSGAGGNGGTGFCVVVSYKDVDIQEFTASGTWSKPVGDYTVAKIFVVGGGGGGGSGRRGATNTGRWGGGGGGGGSITCITVPFSQLGNTETVTVGLGGTGGSAIIVDDTDGNPGTAGGQSSLGSIAVANGGDRGLGGQTSAGGTGGGIRAGFSFPGGSGGSTNGAGAGVNSYTGGGGGGALIFSGGGVGSGFSGGLGAAYTSAITAATGGAGNGGTSGVGQNVSTAPGFYGGNGGGGGGNAVASNAASAGNGAPKGGGGGGGGASSNTYNSGAGGNGGDGYVCVVCI